MKWNFAEKTEHLYRFGFKDNDIEKFSKNITQSLVREAVQNSLDALDIENHSCVRMIVKKGKVSKSTLPNFQEIEKHLRACIDDENDPSENAEIQRHLDAIETSDYSFIEIADYNTIGMDRKSFESLTQASFKSTKTHQGSLGSKGVGKAVYYANSYLRTMLVTTRQESEIRYRAATRLSTHKDPYNPFKEFNNVGFYGPLDPVQESSIPQVFRREEPGTSIFVIGNWKNDNFQEEVIEEVLRNYWFAIADEQLVIEVEGQELNKDNLEQNINRFFPDYKDYKTGEKQNPRAYFESHKNGKLYEREIPHIGTCKLWLNKIADYNLGAVARFRKTKMLIYKENNLDPGFAGVFVCDNEKGNSFLKEIENDAHDEWNPNINLKYRERAKETLNSIKEFIREEYRNYSGIDDTTAFGVDILDDLFNFSTVIGRSVTKNGKPKRQDPDPEDLEKKDRLLIDQNFEAFETKDGWKYALSFKSKTTAYNQRFRVSIGTDSSSDFVDILSAPEGCSFKDNILTISDIREGNNEIFFLELDSPYLISPSITSISK